MKSRSWKTTLGGLLALIGANLALFWPEHCAKLGGFLAALGSGLGLLFARDNDKSSEDVGAGAGSAVPMKKLGVPLFAALLLAAGLGGSGCATSNPEGRLLASTAQTVDAAMKGWSIWVVDGKAEPYSEVRVRELYGRYQLAMAAAKESYTVWKATGEKTPWERASVTLRQSRDFLLNLIDAFQRPIKPPLPSSP